MASKPQQIDFRSGGWVLLLCVAMVAGVVVWRVGTWLGSEGGGAIGDGQDPATYGFDLSALDPQVGATLVGSGLSKDEMPALDAPPRFTPQELLDFNAVHRGKYVVEDDWVIGVTIAGASRAYPLRLLNWHEVINDELGGEPIAVTFHPLCDSVAVYRRALDGQPIEFGVSGLLYDSNAVFFDRGGESLWSQLTGVAIAGPAVGERLEVLPASLTRWGDWLAARPETTIAAPDADKLKRYQKNPYGGYLITGKVRFPVAPESDRATQMEALILVGEGEALRIAEDDTPLSVLSRTTDATEGRLGLLLAEESDVPVRYARRFAIEAQLADLR